MRRISWAEWGIWRFALIPAIIGIIFIVFGYNKDLSDATFRIALFFGVGIGCVIIMFLLIFSVNGNNYKKKRKDNQEIKELEEKILKKNLKRMNK